MNDRGYKTNLTVAPLLLHQLFEAQALRTPLQIAVRFKDSQITYSELDQRATRLSNFILAQAPDAEFIGISATKSIELVVGILAVLKSGKAYLPLDINYPADRLQHIIGDASLQFCLLPEKEQEFFKSLGLHPILLERVYTEPPVKPEIQSSAVCVLYTSGSTGKPKGVRLGHAGFINLFQWQAAKGIAKEGTKSLLFSHLSFDASIQELFVPLLTGGVVSLIDDETRLNAHQLLNFLIQENINRIDLPVVALQYLCEAAEAENCYPFTLQEVVTGGEQLKLTPQIIRFFTALPHCVFVNAYGPTEASVQVTENEFKGNPGSWPLLPSIGKPIAGVEIFMLDEQLNLVSNGKEGELCISGACLAEGYLNNPDLTAEKFLNWQHPERGSIRIYRTGDIAHYNENGSIEFLGRRDEQVKINGYRIELGEIELALQNINGVCEAVVVAKGDTGQKKLVAYLVAENTRKENKELVKQLEKALPYYMVPAAFVWLDEIPKTVSGKIDRKALPAIAFKRPDLSVPYRAPVNATEKLLAKLWIDLLQIDKAGTEDNFFDLGGSSLLAVKMIAALKSQGHELPVARLYQHPTIKAIAAFLEKDKVANTTSAIKKKRQGSNEHEVAVIGLAARFPGADSIEAFWKLLSEGREAIRFFSDDELDSSIPQDLKNDPRYVKGRGVIENVKEFDASFFGINAKLAEMMDPQHRVFLEIAWEALEQAGYSSDKYKSTIGVFAGCENNTYYTHNVLTNKDRVENVGLLQVVTVNDKDYLSSRTAYSLNLKGPAVTVQSACSTSLLTIAQAVESIRNGQCEMALAGGVAIASPMNSGHLYQEGAMLSKDGHCRPFDADAQGTVFSDGAGVVLLKSLKKAEEDGDKIYAVIKGVGVNNDGGGKASFTAPSTEGQAGAIKMAFEDAGIDPATITYIEAHGTATPLGDPIEIEGLNIAFGTQQKKQFCALGSVKSNIGHLSTAAGVAGFIKTVLALHYRTIPPTINYQKANPNIHFEDSPFYVNTELSEWESQTLRRAGVSSFGVGGTNVHAVLEEYPTKEIISGEGKSFQLLAWSAKTEKSRDGYAGQLASYLGKNEAIHLADVAYTLHYRPDFSCRSFVIASDHSDAIIRLKTPESKVLKAAFNGLVFMFPGQGSQHIDMGRELYNSEPVFKDAVDKCATLLQQELGEDIRTIIFPEQKDEEAEAKLKKTCFAQPALFTIEYALAKLWMHWGLKPDIFVGHSVGEFVAAHLAGVFSLEHGLKLIATRGRMMNALPGGGMLSVRMPAAKIAALLSSELSIAAINSPDLCVVAGPDEAIKTLSEKLNSNEVPCRLLHTSHAFHSAMMDPIVEPFKEVVKSVLLHPHNTAIVSTVTGTWLTEAEATDPAYWANHLRATVRFSDALSTATEEDGRLLLEVGPKNTTATLARQQAAQKAAGIVATLETNGSEKAEYASMLRALGQLWLHGIEPDWSSLYNDQQRVRLQLPSYVFDRKRCWVEHKEFAEIQAVKEENISNEIFDESGPALLQEAPLARRDVLIKRIKEILEEASGFETSGFNGDRNFIQLGFDSLLLTQIALTLKKEFNLPISFRMLNTECNTLNLLAAYLDAQLPQHLFAPQPKTPERKELQPVSINAAQAVTGKVTLESIAEQLQLLTRQVALLQGKTVEDTPANQIPRSAQTELKEIQKPERKEAKTSSLELTQRQAEFLESFTHKYTVKTAQSKAYAQKHRSYMADQRVVAGFRPATKELVYPIVANKSKGSRIWDIDGNEYIDIVNGFGSSLLGYQPEIVTKAVLQQIEKGYEIGPQHELAGEVCKLICELTNAERASFCSTGSEAVLGAIRIARTVTGRSTIVSFSGSYHGLFDEVSARTSKKNKSLPSIPGVLPEAVQNILVLDYGTEETLRIIREKGDEIAAVLVEPVQSARPEFQPVTFLKELRKITEASGAALIFDELITGFRMHPGGTQALFGIQADISCYGKAIGGGMPMGVVAGKAKFMDALDGGFWQYGDDSAPETGMTYFAATFDRHPLALVAAKAVLEYLKEKGASLQESIEVKTNRLVRSVNEFCELYSLPLHLVNFGSLFKVKFKEDISYSELLYTILRNKGIHIYDIIPCFLTDAHTEEDVDSIIQAFKESIAEMIDGEFFPFSVKKKKKILKDPPMSNARLGKDADGNAAWFINDPERPGKYLKLEFEN